MNEGDDFSCECRGEGGDPPANITWYKNDVQIIGTGKGNRTFNLVNVDNTASGTYKCVAQSHTLVEEKSVKLIVYCKYEIKQSHVHDIGSMQLMQIK